MSSTFPSSIQSEKQPLSPPLSLDRKTILTIISRGIFIGFYLASLLCALHPDIRQYFRSLLNKPFRQVLSTVSGPLLINSGSAKVIKIKTQEGLFLEIYGLGAEGGRPLLDRIQLPDRRDGYLNFGTNTANLFLQDMDGDDVPEIIAPSFDENLVAHLNIYRFNPNSLKLEVQSPPPPSP